MIDFQELQRHIRSNDAVGVEHELATAPPTAASLQDLKTLLAVLTESIDTNVALEIMQWIEAAGAKPCAAAYVSALLDASGAADSWLEGLIHRLANTATGEAALKDVLRGLSDGDMLRVSALHERLRQLTAPLI
jgi:hypothetical protein